jgi:hypothetical protein
VFATAAACKVDQGRALTTVREPGRATSDDHTSQLFAAPLAEFEKSLAIIAVVYPEFYAPVQHAYPPDLLELSPPTSKGSAS